MESEQNLRRKDRHQRDIGIVLFVFQFLPEIFRLRRSVLLWLFLLGTAFPLQMAHIGKLHASTLIYTIEEGDTLEGIAQRFRVSAAALVKINRFRNIEQAEKSIVRGESILVPEPATTLAAVEGAAPFGASGSALEQAQKINPEISGQEHSPNSKTLEVQAAQAGLTILPQAQIQAEPEVEGSLSIDYQVQSGDTLSSLALRFDIAATTIRQANGLDSDRIRIGQILEIPKSGIAVGMPEGLTGEDLVDPLNLRPATSRRNRETISVSPKINKEIPDLQRVYTVEKGDTLLAISRKTQVSVGVIRVLNQLENDDIRPGQALYLRDPASQSRAVQRQDGPGYQQQDNRKTSYEVGKGDTLSSISRSFNITLSHLQEWNELSDADVLSIGQKLRIGERRIPDDEALGPEATDKYVVAKGDTLWSISRRFGLSTSELRARNPSLENVIYPGQVLQLGSSSLPESSLADRLVTDNLATDSLEGLRGVLPNVYQSAEEETGESEADAQNVAYQRLQQRRRQKIDVAPPASVPQVTKNSSRPVDIASYFTHNPPRVPRQPNASYYEEFTDDPLENYQTARKLLAEFDREVSALPKLGTTLTGYSVLIDPGHGGLDPGFNSQSQDGSGSPLYIIEDEYNYDYALRLYRELRRYGAEVGLTVLSPNQKIVDSPDASHTLVSQKDEVYNSPFINQRGEYNSWPVGTPSGLHKRIEVAESFFNGVPKDKRIFISLHNDNSPWDSDGRLVLYYDDSLTIDRQGEKFAEHIIPSLGKNAHMRGQNLAVLRKNPARYAVLVELRNIAYPRNSWAIRNADLRQEDVEMLSNGVVSFVGSLEN